MAASPGSTPVAFAGLGNIGRPMAPALIDAGWSFDRLDPVPEKARGWGTREPPSPRPRPRLSSCEVLVLAVPDDAAVESLLEGPKGWLARQEPTARSSSTARSCRRPRPASPQAASDPGVGLLDAPVSGGADRAEQGDLTIMVGGEEKCSSASVPCSRPRGA